MTGLLTAFGAEVELVETPHPVGGWQEAAAEASKRSSPHSPTPGAPTEYNNPDNVAAYAPLAHELVAQLGRIDTW
ncbi:Putative cysteine synthase A CysK2 OS=Streptomyces microflavus OX=1919 GN=Smic_07990 PE=4 SV=1 [Streptomyces microflavus]